MMSEGHNFLLVLFQIILTLMSYEIMVSSETDLNNKSDRILKEVEKENPVNCNQFTSGEVMMHANWIILKSCLPTIAQENVNEEIAKNIWYLIKDANRGLDNIEAETFQIMGNFVTKIPVDDLKNITFDEVEVIKTFGEAEAYGSDEKLKLIAKKIKTEWKSKNPEKFSQYDLEILGQILCFFNKSDIARIHPDAYKGAAKLIGELSNCPMDIYQEFGKLAVQKDAFGPPNKWSKVDVNLVGNVIQGLNTAEFASINPENLVGINHLLKQKITNSTQKN